MNRITLALTSVAALSTVALTGCGPSVDEPGPENALVNMEAPGLTPAAARECSDDCYSWECTDTTCDAKSVAYDEDCCAGRPLVIDGVARVADIEVRDDWATG